MRGPTALRMSDPVVARDDRAREPSSPFRAAPADAAGAGSVDIDWGEAHGLAFALLRDHAMADDLCQEARVRLEDRAADLDRSRSLREWVLTVVRRLAISELRRRRPRSLQDEECVDDAAPDPLLAAERAERARILREVLSEMDPVWRAMLYLKDGLGLRYREIGEVLGKSEDMVRVTLHRARARAREALVRRRVMEDPT